VSECSKELKDNHENSGIHNEGKLQYTKKPLSLFFKQWTFGTAPDEKKMKTPTTKNSLEKKRKEHQHENHI